MVPFFHILSQMSYSVLWPLQNLEYGGMQEYARVPVINVLKCVHAIIIII